MGNQPKWSNYTVGLEVGQKYLAHLSELSSTPSLSEPQLREARKDLSDKHSLYCSQERQAIIAQCRRDRAAAWERYLEAEWRHLQQRQEGQLAKMLGSPLPGESCLEAPRFASHLEPCCRTPPRAIHRRSAGTALLLIRGDMPITGGKQARK
jgi:hypothetical protein